MDSIGAAVPGSAVSDCTAHLVSVRLIRVQPLHFCQPDTDGWLGNMKQICSMMRTNIAAWFRMQAAGHLSLGWIAHALKRRAGSVSPVHAVRIASVAATVPKKVSTVLARCTKECMLAKEGCRQGAAKVQAVARGAT